MRRSFVSLLIGISLAAFAVFLMSSYKDSVLTMVPVSKDKNIEIVQIVVAAEDLPFGTKILRDHLEYKSWPKSSLPKDTFTDMNLLLKNKDGEKGNRVIIRQLFEGEPLIKKKISGFGTRPTLSRKVAENKRAFSIRINDVSGVAGFLLPGDKVDVMLTRKEGKNNSNLVTDIILQNLTILGIDQLINEVTEKPIIAKTATVEVTVEQAQKLALAQQIGTLSLTLRNYSDSKEVAISRVAVGDLSGITGKKKVTQSGTIVRVRRGTNVEYTRIP